MAQTVIINGVTYSGVPSVKLPLANDPATLAVFPDTSDATATSGDILTGETAYVGGEMVSGAMPNNGTYSQTITTAAQVVTLSAGSYAGGTVQLDPSQQALLVPGNLLAGVTILGVTGEADVNNTSLPETGAAAGEILAGAQAWVNGELVTGSMPNNGAYQQTISAVSPTVTIPEGYHNGSGTVEIDSGDQALLVAANIKSGVTILGVAGSPNVNDTTLTSTAAGAGDITSGKQAWVNGVLLTGTGTQPSISLSGGVLSIS